MTTTKKLSERQSRILEFIKQFMSEHQFPPTVRDIQGRLRDQLHLGR